MSGTGWWVSSRAGDFSPFPSLGGARIPLHLARCPAPQMFEDSADDFGVIDQRDDLHRRAALGTFQGIGLVDLVDQSRPRRPGARRNHLSEQTGSTPNDPPPRRRSRLESAIVPRYGTAPRAI